MSIKDAKYYISETKEFVSYDELVSKDYELIDSTGWRTHFDNLSPYDINL
jgi:hypothetical protein|tara:strand:- start:3513 stop:3662 length:150 start_codon:yes stop_codon:yes gene_type:complete